MSEQSNFLQSPIISSGEACPECGMKYGWHSGGCTRSTTAVLPACPECGLTGGAHLSTCSRSVTPPVQQFGWTCPRCGQVWAPFIHCCVCPVPTVISTTMKIGGE